MKILLATSSFNGGGIASYAHEVISNYSKENDLFVMIGHDKKSPITTKNVKIYYFDVVNISLKNLQKILYVINNEIKPDIVINSFAPAISILAPYLNNNIKLVTVSHSLKYIEAEIAGMNHNYIDHIIALSHFGKSYLQKKFKIDSTKISVIYNFVNSYNNAQQLQKDKMENKRIKIVFPGGCAGSKTPELVLKIVRELLNTKLDFDFYWLGGSMIHLSRYFPLLGLNDISDLLPNDSRLHITGKISRDKAIEMLAKTNIFLFPSRREGCPMSLIETMRVGAICIVSDFDNANKELIINEKNGFVISHKNVADFIVRIKDIINRHSSYKKYYQYSYNSYQENLCFDIWKKNMDQILLKSQCSHSVRKYKPSIFKLQKDILHYKLRSILCKIQVTIEEDLKVLLAFYKLKNK